MKKIITLSLFLALGNFALAQLFQATIKNSPTAGKFRLAIKPNIAVVGAISSVTFTIAIPSSILPRPTINVLPIATGLTFVVGQAVEADNAANNYYSYAVVFDGNSPLNLIANQEWDIADMEFGGSAGNTATARLSNFANGGADLNHVFYIAIGGADRVNYPQPFYGPGVVNNGGGLSTYSFVPLAGVTLPVKFASFFAYKQNNDGFLNWTIENQNSEVKHFEIERSFDGITFNKIAQKDPILNANNITTYNLTDAGVFDIYKGTIYYRIKQVDRNGVVTYSIIRTLKTDSKAFAINLYPNPVVKNATIIFYTDKVQNVVLQLVDMQGKVLANYSVLAVKGINQKSIDVSALSNGAYTFIIKTNKETENLQFVKSN